MGKETDIEVRSPNNNTLANLSSPSQLLAFGEELVKSGLCPQKTAADVMAAIILGREIGLGTMTSVNHIHSVNGRASVGVHIIMAKLLQAGVTYEIKKDYEPIYEFRTKDGITYKEEIVVNNLDKFQIVTAKTLSSEYIKDRILVIRSVIDTVSVIEFSRKVKQPDNTWEIMTLTSTFGWADVVMMGLNTRDNWTKMPKLMLRTRNLVTGGRLIAPDYLLGIYENSEIADVNNIPYTVDADTNEVVITNVTTQG